MIRFLAFCSTLVALAFTAACSSDDSTDDGQGPGTSDTGTPDAAISDAATPDAGGGPSFAALDLTDVAANPDDYEWFDFRPNVLKLILAGAAETEHIAILWYTVEDGAVGLHYHSKTESVYVIDGTQTDAEGVYTTGTVYFNPPGSGHMISDSSGFFLLAYASPPDFMATDRIEEYAPIRIETDSAELTADYAFEETAEGVAVYAVPLDDDGGMSAEFIETTAPEPYEYLGNYLLVVEGSCDIGGDAYGENALVVAEGVEPLPFQLSASEDSRCLALGLSF